MDPRWGGPRPAGGAERRAVHYTFCFGGFTTSLPYARCSGGSAGTHPSVCCPLRKRHYPAEARLKQAKEERAKGGRPGLIRRNSFVMAAKGAQAARDYEAQVATVLVRNGHALLCI